jgi:hypothetical protein
LCGGAIDMGQPVRRKEVVQIFVLKVMPQNIRDVLVNGTEPSFRRAALRLLVQLIAELNVVDRDSSSFV